MKISKHIKIADLFTLANLISGFLSILCSADKNFILAAVFMLFAVFFDFIDGKISRLLNSANEFGKELDSLSDIVSFGIAPAVFGYLLLSISINKLVFVMPYSIVFMLYVLFVVILLFFISAGALRLARFNTTNVKGFEGVPITVNGFLFPLLYFALMLFSFNAFAVLVFGLIYFIMALLMISSIRIKKI